MRAPASGRPGAKSLGRQKPFEQAIPGEAEGEGFEPSIRLTTDNGFRDGLQTGDLQGF